MNDRTFAFQESPTVTEKAYLDIAIDGRPAGRLVIGLYGDECPKTVKNFTSLVTGTNFGGFKNSTFHRVVSNFVIQGGDFTQGNGFGGRSIYGNPLNGYTFNDENLSLHHKEGALAMANRGPNTNSSQFYICVRDTPFLDGKYVVFGEVLEGIELVQKANKVPVDFSSKPKTPIRITDCGLLES